MPSHSLWKGHLKLSLVSVPVRAYSAEMSGGGEIHLNQLHEKCHSRIKYVKTCPIHGPVPNDEIVSGYEYTKGQYVIIGEDEIEKARSEKDYSVNIEAFVQSDTIDPVYYSGKTYYLVPDGAVGQKPYALIHQSMEKEQLAALGQVVFSNREQLVLVRPLEKLLAMEVLHHADRIKPPSEFEDELNGAPVSKAERDLTKTLIEAFVRDAPHLENYRDAYKDKLHEVIEAKVHHKELIAPPEPTEPRIINLMDALKKSVARSKGEKPKGAGARPMTPKRKKALEGAKPSAKRGHKRTG